VPEDFKPKGGKERLTITVNYDTQTLYGRVQASREIIVAK
jgi:hypothetical protein